MAIQLSSAKTEFGYMKRDIHDVDDNTWLAWSRYIQNYIYRKLVETDPSWFVTTQSYTVQNGTQNLPNNFKNIRPQGTGFYLVDNSGNVTNTKLSEVPYGSNQQGFYIVGNTVVFSGFSNSQPYILRYVPTISQFTSVSDYFTTDLLSSGIAVIPDDMMEYLIQAYDVFYGQWSDDPSAEQGADFRYTRVLDELLMEIRRTPGVYSIESNDALYGYNPAYGNNTYPFIPS